MRVEHSISPDLWRAVWRLADAWAETQVVKELAATLPRNQVQYTGTQVTIPMLTEPTSIQRQAFQLLGTAIPLTLK